ncbi:MAG TPA: cytochrome c [Longimicrobium sp.]|jgi:mono/diheme cytochrome c family protein
MNRALTGRSRLPIAALLLAAAVAGCKPGGDYGFDRVSYRETPEVPQPTNPDPPPVPAGGLASAAQAKLVAKNLPSGVTQAMVDEGQTQFGTVCVGCHGPGGVGTPAAPALNDASWINVSGAYPEIVNIINTGVPAPKQHTGAMPPKGGGSFTDDQVRALAAYVFALSQQGES